MNQGLPTSSMSALERCNPVLCAPNVDFGVHACSAVREGNVPSTEGQRYLSIKHCVDPMRTIERSLVVCGGHY